MALDARSRSSIYGKFARILGPDDANALMSEFPSVEADELVTKQFLRAELAELRLEMSALRLDMSEKFRQQTTLLGGMVAGGVVILSALEALL